MLVCACRTRSTDHQRVQRYAPFHSTAICTRLGIRDSLWMFFAYKKNARPNWDANSWQDVLPDDTISLRHLPRRSIKNCDLQSANVDGQTDRFKANYSIDIHNIYIYIYIYIYMIYIYITNEKENYQCLSTIKFKKSTWLCRSFVRRSFAPVVCVR